MDLPALVHFPLTVVQALLFASRRVQRCRFASGLWSCPAASRQHSFVVSGGEGHVGPRRRCDQGNLGVGFQHQFQSWHHTCRHRDMPWVLIQRCTATVCRAFKNYAPRALPDLTLQRHAQHAACVARPGEAVHAVWCPGGASPPLGGAADAAAWTRRGRQQQHPRPGRRPRPGRGFAALRCSAPGAGRGPAWWPRPGRRHGQGPAPWGQVPGPAAHRT